MSDATRRAVLALGVIALVGGIAGLAYSSGQDLTAPRGARVGEFMHLNPLGSIISIVLALVALAAGWWRSHGLTLAASAGFWACVVLVALQANREPNLLGGTASTVAFHLGLAAGLLALALSERAAQRVDAGTDHVERDAAAGHPQQPG